MHVLVCRVVSSTEICIYFLESSLHPVNQAKGKHAQEEEKPVTGGEDFLTVT